MSERSESAAYWEQRARRYAAQGEGLAAVCSCGMPGYYNRAIDWCQRLALDPWLAVRPGTKALDLGCGVGRWSRRLAARGARVTGVDLSPAMVAEARRRAAAEGLAMRCRFLEQELASLDVPGRFDLVLGVTVLQHILDPGELRSAVQRMAEHVAATGVLVLLEAAPVHATGRCDSPTFRARPRAEYLQLFADCGLRLWGTSGVDPSPFRQWLLPWLPRLPWPLRTVATAGATALSLAIDLPFGRRAPTRSWHAVFVLQRQRG
jgi:SAM-dependent methyltransferase